MAKYVMAILPACALYPNREEGVALMDTGTEVDCYRFGAFDGRRRVWADVNGDGYVMHERYGLEPCWHKLEFKPWLDCKFHVTSSVLHTTEYEWEA